MIYEKTQDILSKTTMFVASTWLNQVKFLYFINHPGVSFRTFQVTVAMGFCVPGGKAGINAPVVTTSAMIKCLSV